MGIRNYLKRREERKAKQKERKERIEKRAAVYEIMLTDISREMLFGCILDIRTRARELAELAEKPAGSYLHEGELTLVSDVPKSEGFSYNYCVVEKIRSETTVGLKNEPNHKN